MTIHRLVRPLVLLLMLMSIPALSFGGVFVSVSVGPPPIPVYTQPLCPGSGYMWTPGYWGWGDDGYYWVPGTWVMAPEPGLLWTPGYWGWGGGVYLWHGGYWGPHVGFYGGINYGFGYGGYGYGGGEWRGRNFYYNRSVNNVNVTNITNVYNKTVIVNNNTHVSYNGGNGGVRTRETAQEQRWQHEKHIEPTQVQMQHHSEAGRNPQLFARNNGGKPAIAATARPGDFQHGVPAKAVGGRVDRAVLTASPKNMPSSRTTANVNGGAKGNANVPRPNNAGANAHTSTAVNGDGHSVPKPPSATSRSASTHGNASVNSPRSYPPQQGATSMNHQNAPKSYSPSGGSPAVHQNQPAPHYNAPQQHSAPPVQHNAAPQQHSAPQHGGPPQEGKPRR
jgi:WXXGXW repeat (2 copies)